MEHSPNELPHILSQLQALKQVPIDALLEQRYQRYRKLGQYLEQDVVRVG